MALFCIDSSISLCAADRLECQTGLAYILEDWSHNSVINAQQIIDGRRIARKDNVKTLSQPTYVDQMLQFRLGMHR